MQRFGKPRKLKRRGRSTTTYYVRTWDSSGWNSELNTSETSLRGAQRWLEHHRQMLAEKELRGLRGDEELPALTFNEAADRWLQWRVSRNLSGSALLTVSSLVTAFWKPSFGKRQLGDVTQAHLEQYIDRRLKGTAKRFNTRTGQMGLQAKPLSEASRNDEVGKLRSFFRWCIDEGLLEKSPALRLVKRESSARQDRVSELTEEEELRLLRSCEEPYAIVHKLKGDSRRKNEWSQSVTPPPYLRPIVELALWTGFRKGTLLQLTWGMLVKDGNGYRWRVPGHMVKNREDLRLEAHPVAVRAFERHRDRVREMCLRDHGDVSKKLHRDARLFDLAEDAKLSRVFRAACLRAGIDGLKFHDFRGIFANRLLESGASVQEAMGFTGHRSVQTILKHYASTPSRARQQSVLSKLKRK